jgi:hypothetical protein
MGQMIMCTLAELGWKLRWADNFFAVQHINCQLIMEIQEINKNVLQTVASEVKI